MKRALVLLSVLSLALLLPSAFAQENSTQVASETPGEGLLFVWRVVNFILLVGALGYLARKYGGPFFVLRSRKIRQEMMDAEQARKEAEGRAAEVDRRLASLETDIANLRAESQREAARQQERIRQQTAADMAKIRTHAEQEIAAAGKAARLELKRYSAHLAIELAEQKLRARVTPETQDALVRGFAHELDPARSQAQTT